ncbi:MAG TPA: dUTP diphosphatase [Acidimicrobiales bacterium]|nr:dUTP diphosphatase [Acidimicrobiales bacterium]
MEIFTKVLHPDAVLPSYANEGDAGCDLVAVESCTLSARGGRALVATGLAVAIPEGHGGFVLPRSGLASKHGVTCANSPGLIDPGYRGEVKVALVNLDPEHDYHVEKGDRIAQLVVVPLATSNFLVVDELPSAPRGEGGFGSSGR